ncbi:atrial natriuretic peptide receptor 1-like isoform X2 [Paramacrobiotus metropolitanus]|uniref:atrial natriuretic peptide receptor 1-like isoform X2 n=1 Tax=Paramacrobiotus metropolitanus TaxID=2943436 RepID=UPI0024457693|nr:atrial natriuretic peptide receptor 1-like isoform X2 [Paramacrobiotus metropolitanus]
MIQMPLQPVLVVSSGLYNSNPYATAISFFPIRHDTSSNVSRNLLSAYSRGRIHVLVGDAEMVRQYLVGAHDLGMTNGEHMYFAPDFHRDTIIKPTKETGWKRGDGNDEKAKDAYRSLLVIGLRDRSADPSYLKFVDELKEWGRTNQYTRPDLLSAPDYYMISYHDAVLLPAAGVGFYHEIQQSALPLAVLPSYSFGDAPVVFNTSLLTSAMQQITWNYSKSGLRLSEKLLTTKTREVCDSFNLYGMSNASNGVLQLLRAYNASSDPNITDTTVELCPTTPSVIRAIVWPNANNTPPVNEPVCGYLDEKCPPYDYLPTYIMIGIGAFFLPIILIGCAIATWKGFRYYRSAWNWIVHPSDVRVSWPNSAVPIDIEDNASIEPSLNARHQGWQSEDVFPEPLMPEISTVLGRWKRKMTAVRHCYKKYVVKHFRLLQEVEWARKIDHDNVLKFLGASIDINHVAVLYEEIGNRGRLIDLIHMKPKMDWEVRFSFASDIIHGLLHLYFKWLQCHGRLTSFCLWIDEKFVVKISDYGLPSFLDLNMVEYWFAKKCPGFSQSLLWTSPEVLRSNDSNQRSANLMNRSVDIYSYGIIMQELILWDRPYCMFDYTPTEIVSYVRYGQTPEGIPMRPKFTLDVDCDTQLLELVQICWNESQHERPDWSFVRGEISRVATKMCTKSGGSLADALMAQMENLTNSLENVVHKLDFQAYVDQQKKNAMLYVYIPRAVAGYGDNMSTSCTKVYDHVTVVCSDVLTPSVIRAQSSPVQVIDCLEKLGQLVGDVLETSGMSRVSHFQDTVIAASGVPVESSNHATDAVKYALRLVSALESFVIPYKPDYRFKPRVGISSGAVVGGVLSTKIPRFFIYGEAVLIALRMLHSIGNYPGIQISGYTRELLQRSDFVVEHRGPIPYKDRHIDGYWLHGSMDAVLELFAIHNPMKTAVVKRPSFLFKMA